MTIDPKNISLDLKIGPFNLRITPDDSPAATDTKTKLEQAKARRNEVIQLKEALDKLIKDMEGS